MWSSLTFQTSPKGHDTRTQQDTVISICSDLRQDTRIFTLKRNLKLNYILKCLMVLP